jgi:hypothetical protein
VHGFTKRFRGNAADKVVREMAPRTRPCLRRVSTFGNPDPSERARILRCSWKCADRKIYLIPAWNQRNSSTLQARELDSLSLVRSTAGSLVADL